MASEEEYNGEDREEWPAVTPNGDRRAEWGGISKRTVQLWALVLDARCIPCRIEPYGAGWQLLVPPEQLAAARQELLRFEEENRGWPPPAPQASPLVENTLVTLSVLLLLAIFHNVTQLDIPLFGLDRIDWINLGSADSAKILDGQWWRLLTALTLHADWLHLVSNLAIGGIFIIFLCRELGSGLSWGLLVMAGALGNLANAWAQPINHSSVGASTAVFSAVGILAAISLVRYRHQLQRRWLLPVAAALALLALLGTEGKHTDLGAHLFGLFFGVGLGLPAEYLVGRWGRPGRVLNPVLALTSLMMVVAAWWAALAS